MDNCYPPKLPFEGKNEGKYFNQDSNHMITNVQNPQDVPELYNPKLCIQKLLMDLIPTILIENPNINHHEQYENFYQKCKKYLTYFETSTSIMPPTLKITYSDFSKKVGAIHYVNTLNINNVDQSKVELYQNIEDSRYVLKQNWFKFDLTTKSPDIIQDLELFISDKFNEYKILQIFSASPNSVNPIDFHFVYLPSLKLFVTELILPFEGEPIQKRFPIKNSTLVYEFFSQIADILKCLEEFRIEHNDIKPSNILVNGISGVPILKLIGFELSGYKSSSYNDEFSHSLRGYTDAYASPEILKIFHSYSKNNALFHFNPSSCQIYSVGMTFLTMIGFFPKMLPAREIDKLKVSESEYSKFLELIKVYDNEITDPLMKNILLLITFCVSYDPKYRLSTKELSIILKGLDKKECNQIRQQYAAIISNRPNLHQ